MKSAPRPKPGPEATLSTVIRKDSYSINRHSYSAIWNFVERGGTLDDYYLQLSVPGRATVSPVPSIAAGQALADYFPVCVVRVG